MGKFVIWSHEQTSGRGRSGRKWCSDLGNLYFSILISDNTEISKLPQMSFVTALAMYDTVSALLPSNIQCSQIKLKWPNDILFEKAKIGGILLEAISSSELKHLIIGVGLNVSSAPKLKERNTCCLKDLGASPIDLDIILDIFINHFDHYLLRWHQDGFQFIREDWLKKSEMLGSLISFHDGNRKISGIFQDIDSYGNICIMNEGGLLEKFASGEIE
jgi:BirA family biotin operon repressor/biotin-[acetyl-CoA-carboxylase] ligase